MEQEQQQVRCMVEEVMKAGGTADCGVVLEEAEEQEERSRVQQQQQQQQRGGRTMRMRFLHHPTGRIPWRSCRVRFEISQSLAL
jgi:hypothetical protein